MPLVDQNQLEQALSDAPTRNKLIKQLRATPASESFYLRKLVLSMWLGANFRLPRAYRNTSWEEAVSLIYFCLLGFDKTLSTLKNGHAKTYLMACQKALFQFYNLHSHYLRELSELIDAFKTILNHHYYHSNQVESNDNQIISATLTMCSAELERFGTPKVNDLTPTPAIATYRVSPQSYFERFCHYVVKQHATLGLPPNYFYPESMGDTNHLDLRFKKLFIQAADGAILDALIAKEIGSKRPLITLALIGHFENERAYISGDVRSIYRSIFTNLAFINHRHFSQRASLGAPNNALLSADIVEFAKYYHAKNKKIILYGMCGGAALMILAAKQLDELQIPYRIILDRFSQRATDSIHLKNLIRHFRFSHFAFNYEILYKSIILFFIYILMRLALKTTHNAYELGHILQNIPKNKTLVLQIRDRKKETGFADLFFHPEHELRAAQKLARGREKMLLRQLQAQAESLAEHFTTHSALHTFFHELQSGFADMQILIRNEKMTGNPSLKIPNCNITNLHSNKLSELTTRDNFSLARLIQGFIKPTHPDTTELFAQFETIDLAQIKNHLTTLPWLELNEERAAALSSSEKYQLAEILCSFLRTLIQEKTYLSYMADRAAFTALKDIKPALQGLIKTPLMLSLQPIKLSTGAHCLTLFPSVQAIEKQDNHSTPACTKSSN